MVLGNHVIKDMGGRIDDALGIDFITNGNCRFWYPILHYRTLLVKITDENAKQQGTKALNIENWVSIDYQLLFVTLVQYTASSANMKLQHENAQRHQLN
jgi:K(+)-stimulated pyrophosphate-energized sodium pump